MRLFQAALDTPLDSTFSATLSVHGLSGFEKSELFECAFGPLSRNPFSLIFTPIP